MAQHVCVVWSAQAHTKQTHTAKTKWVLGSSTHQLKIMHEKEKEGEKLTGRPASLISLEDSQTLQTFLLFPLHLPAKLLLLLLLSNSNTLDMANWQIFTALPAFSFSFSSFSPATADTFSKHTHTHLHTFFQLVILLQLPSLTYRNISWRWWRWRW